MWNPRDQLGILNDFYLASAAGHQKPSGGDQTGTVPFMAVDLPCIEYFDGKKVREYRHNFKSFVWVLVWTASADNNSTEYTWPIWRASKFRLSRAAKRDITLAVDLDKPTNFKGTPPRRKRWLFTVALLDYLLALESRSKIKSYEDRRARIVIYA